MMARIIVVEDDTHISRVICLWLKRNGHEVTTAVDGRSALQIIREHRPDLLLADVNMPIMDGIKLLQAVRDEGLMDAPAIVLTSRCDQAEIAARASSLGAVVHPKPFSPLHLMEAIETALGNRCASATTRHRSPAGVKQPGPDEPVAACDLLGAPRHG
jgi:CheY-like chemotaxis protein